MTSTVINSNGLCIILVDLVHFTIERNYLVVRYRSHFLPSDQLHQVQEALEEVLEQGKCMCDLIADIY